MGGNQPTSQSFDCLEVPETSPQDDGSLAVGFLGSSLLASVARNSLKCVVRKPRAPKNGSQLPTELFGYQNEIELETATNML